MARPVAKHPPPRSTPPHGLRLIPGYGSGPPARKQRPLISNAHIGVVLLIASEAMLFAALLVAYWSLRRGNPNWAPADLPRLPLAITAINGALLLTSAVTVWIAVRTVGRGELRDVPRALSATILLGTVFVLVQGSEWVNLFHDGLTLGSGLYGASFYTLIGMHALHVVAALAWLFVVLKRAQRGSYSSQQHAPLSACAMYWTFVCALWPILFVAVYLW